MRVDAVDEGGPSLLCSASVVMAQTPVSILYHYAALPQNHNRTLLSQWSS